MHYSVDDANVEKEKIFASRKNDTWEIYENTNGFNWRRTASNNEIVGGSHRAFSTRSECVDNAQLFGYQERYHIAHKKTEWEFYQDGQNEYRWRVTSNGEKLNVCHEGYKSELSAIKNAVRHGYGTTQTHSCWACFFQALLAALALLILLFLILGGFDGAYKEPEAPKPIIRAEFDDVNRSDWHWDYVTRMAGLKIIEGYKEDGVPTGEYGPQDPVTLEQMTKILVLATQSDTKDCKQVMEDEPANERWSDPYFACARSLGWNSFKDKSRDYRQDATRGEVAQAITEAFEVKNTKRVQGIFKDVQPGNPFGQAIEALHKDEIVSGYGDGEIFGVENSTQRAEAAKMVYLAIDKYGEQ